MAVQSLTRAYVQILEEFNLAGPKGQSLVMRKAYIPTSPGGGDTWDPNINVVALGFRRVVVPLNVWASVSPVWPPGAATPRYVFILKEDGQYFYLFFTISGSLAFFFGFQTPVQCILIGEPF